MAAYHMGWSDRDGRPTDSQPGKFIRPALCLWAAEACGGELAACLPVAAALEWVHNFTLVHDDIQDGDRERRNRDTVWAVWGSAQGINAGDALAALAFRTLARDGAAHPQRLLDAVRLIADAVLVVIEGQSQDLRLEGKPQTSLRTYLRMIRSKTAALIGASLEAGAVSAGAPPPVARGLRDAGVLLGTAFQVRDDWLGTWGDSAATGKSSSGDLGRCKLTYPVVAGYAVMDEERRTRMRLLFREPAPNAAAVRALLEEVGGPQLTGSAPRHFADKATKVVQALRLPSRLVDDFSEVAHYVANRSR
jgi:geranylgeranyl diphosphate synthase, type I